MVVGDLKPSRVSNQSTLERHVVAEIAAMDASHLFSETSLFRGFETTIIKDGVKVETPIMMLGGNAENKSINARTPTW